MEDHGHRVGEHRLQGDGVLRLRSGHLVDHGDGEAHLREVAICIWFNCCGVAETQDRRIDAAHSEISPVVLPCRLPSRERFQRLVRPLGRDPPVLVQIGLHSVQ